MKFSIITVSFFLMILFITHTFLIVGECPLPVPLKYAHVKPGGVVAAYFGGWDQYGGRYTVDDIEQVAHLLTHIVYAFARPNGETGACDLSDEWADVGANFEHRKKVGGNFGKLLQLKKKYPHLKILLSVGGGTYSQAFSQIAAKGKIQYFVKSVLSVLDQYEYVYEHSVHGGDQVHVFEYPGLFDGVDLDWEWVSSSISPDEVKAYKTMVQLLSKSLKKRSEKNILTCAIQVNTKIISSLQLGDIAHLVDWFHVMSYNYGGPTASGISMNAPICNQYSDYSIDGSLNILMNMGVSPAKMVLGIPLYGHVYDKTNPKLGSVFEKTQRTGAFSYEQIKQQYLDSSDCYTKWHSVSKVPYAYCPEEKIFVSYDNPESVIYKVLYARNKKLRGIFFWRLSGDDKNHSLVKSIQDKI